MSIYQNAFIYFMSGTGNTFRVATWVGEEINNQDTNYKFKTEIIETNIVKRESTRKTNK